MNGRNAEGYSDPTATKALQSVEVDEQKLRKLRKLLEVIADLAGYYIVSKITFRDKATGYEVRR
jgi:hypothetical protein